MNHLASQYIEMIVSSIRILKLLLGCTYWLRKKNKRKGQDIRESTRIICSQYINRINQQ